MTPKMHDKILTLMQAHDTMTVATVRPDGYPQATTVTYANDGTDLYFCCDESSQKVRNIMRNRKVSVTIDHDCRDWRGIQGLSLGGTARVVKRRTEFERALALLKHKFRELAKMDDDDLAGMAIVRVTPKVFSVLDYRLGFGHADLVKA